jgi:hypothetical protein
MVIIILFYNHPRSADGGDCEANEGPGKEAHIFPIFGRAFWYLPYIEPSKHTAGKCDDQD